MEERADSPAQAPQASNIDDGADINNASMDGCGEPMGAISAGGGPATTVPEAVGDANAGSLRASLAESKQVSFSLHEEGETPVGADTSSVSSAEIENAVGDANRDSLRSSMSGPKQVSFSLHEEGENGDDDGAEMSSVSSGELENAAGDTARMLRRAPALRQRQGSCRRTAITSIDLNTSMARQMSNLELATKGKDWIRSFRDLDPRIQILEFFNDLSLEGVKNFEMQGCRTKGAVHMPIILRIFVKSGIFSVWRPTSLDAIAKMITGEGTGKGLEIKGKSSKRGRSSGFVPYLQIHDNEHKNRMGRMREQTRVRVFYPNESSRDAAAGSLAAGALADRSEMMEAGAIVENRLNEKEKGLREQDFESVTNDDRPSARRPSLRPSLLDSQFIDEQYINEAPGEKNDPREYYAIDDYSLTEGIYGLDISEKLFWESYVLPNDISRPEGSDLDTGRPSMPEFQQMNIDTLRNWKEKSPSNDGKSDAGGDGGVGAADLEAEADPRPVLWHSGCGGRGDEAPKGCNPMCPLGLLMAYEENDKVTPVVSDFDCFLLGTRGVKYEKPFGAQEFSMLTSCVKEIEGILATPQEGCSWTTRWLEVKKKHANENNTHQMPKFGYADPLSYSMMTGAVRHLKSNGAVRHGPESFNYGFPQELDDQYLVISDTFPGVPWRYANGKELIEILSEKIDEGFTFPLNPKWILCDPGWKKLYDKLLGSTKANVQNSLDIWYPDEIRRRINKISSKFPEGFASSHRESGSSDFSSTVLFDLAQLELKRYRVRLSSRRKLRNALSRRSLGSERYIYRGCEVAASQGESKLASAAMAVHMANMAIQEEDMTTKNRDGRKKRRGSSITVDILRTSGVIAAGSLRASLLALDEEPKLESIEDRSNDAVSFDALPPQERRRSSASSKKAAGFCHFNEDSNCDSEVIEPKERRRSSSSMTKSQNSSVHGSDPSANNSNGEEDVRPKKRGSGLSSMLKLQNHSANDSNREHDVRPKGKRGSDLSSMLKSQKSGSSHGSNSGTNLSDERRGCAERDSEDAATQPKRTGNRRIVSSTLNSLKTLKSLRWK